MEHKDTFKEVVEALECRKTSRELGDVFRMNHKEFLPLTGPYALSLEEVQRYVEKNALAALCQSTTFQSGIRAIHDKEREMNESLFPFYTKPIAAGLAKAMRGEREVVGDVPAGIVQDVEADEHPQKFVIALTPHETWKDLISGIYVYKNIGKIENMRALGKAHWTVKGFGKLFNEDPFQYVDRSKSTGIVGQVVDEMIASDHYTYVLAVEGTRNRNQYMDPEQGLVKLPQPIKTSFYHVARRAGVPIVFLTIDKFNQRFTFSDPIYPRAIYDDDDFTPDFSCYEGYLQSELPRYQSKIGGKYHPLSKQGQKNAKKK